MHSLLSTPALQSRIGASDPAADRAG